MTRSPLIAKTHRTTSGALPINADPGHPIKLGMPLLNHMGQKYATVESYIGCEYNEHLKCDLFIYALNWLEGETMHAKEKELIASGKVPTAYFKKCGGKGFEHADEHIVAPEQWFALALLLGQGQTAPLRRQAKGKYYVPAVRTVQSSHYPPGR